jgi:hypothetical protein
MVDLELDEPFEAPPLKPPLANTSSSREKEPDESLEKIRKWQEERISRKLKGEYESAVLHLNELVRITRCSLWLFFSQHHPQRLKTMPQPV